MLTSVVKADRSLYAFSRLWLPSDETAVGTDRILHCHNLTWFLATAMQTGDKYRWEEELYILKNIVKSLHESSVMCFAIIVSRSHSTTLYQVQCVYSFE